MGAVALMEGKAASLKYSMDFPSKYIAGECTLDVALAIRIHYGLIARSLVFQHFLLSKCKTFIHLLNEFFNFLICHSLLSY